MLCFFLVLFTSFPWSSFSESMIATCTFPPFQNDRPACGLNGLKCCPGFHCQDGTCISMQKGSASEFALMAHAMSMSADAIVDDITSKMTTVATSIIRAETIISDMKTPNDFDPFQSDSVTNNELNNLNISADLYVGEVQLTIKQVLERLNRMEKEYKDFVLESQILIQQLIKEKKDKLENIGNRYEANHLLPETINKSTETFVRSCETYLDTKEHSFRFALANKLANLETFISRETSKISYMDSVASCNSSKDKSLCVGNAANSLVRSTASLAENAAIRILSAAAYLRKSADSLVLLNGFNTIRDVTDTKNTGSHLKIPNGVAGKRSSSPSHTENAPDTDFAFAAMIILSLNCAACIFWNLMTRCRSSRTGYERI